MSFLTSFSSFFPPTYERWSLIKTVFSCVPLFTLGQWLFPYQPMGKTSIVSSLNLPGKFAWCVMELPGPINMAYIMLTVPNTTLPLRNYLLAGLYVLHYINRAIITPIFLADSLSPIHLSVFLSATLFNYMNSSTIGGWLAGYGGEAAMQSGYQWQIQLGLLFFAQGMIGNIMAEGHLRDIRREAAAKQAAEEKQGDKPVKHEKVYALPDAQNTYFKYCLFPHYTLEWLEWAGFCVIGGWQFTPGIYFLINEIATMTPRAVWGRRWYVEKFGKDAVGDQRGAVLPRYWGIG